VRSVSESEIKDEYIVYRKENRIQEPVTRINSYLVSREENKKEPVFRSQK
jgi:hypothetical protein